MSKEPKSTAKSDQLRRMREEQFAKRTKRPPWVSPQPPEKATEPAPTPVVHKKPKAPKVVGTGICRPVSAAQQEWLDDKAAGTLDDE